MNKMRGLIYLQVCVLHILMNIDSCCSIECGTRPGLKNVTRHTRIANNMGHFAEPGEVPWQVQLRDSSTGFRYCGGALLDDHHVLTAAHCASKNWKNPNKEIVPLKPSDVFIKLGHNNASHGETFNVSSITVHPHFNEYFVHDLAVLKLSDNVNFSNMVVPACLPSNETHRISNAAIISGWGIFSRDGYQATMLRVAKVHFTETEECEKNFQIKQFDGMICGRKSLTHFCAGDSGGPVTQEYDGKWYIIAIMSLGKRDACYKGKEAYTVYMNVVEHSTWIQQVISDDPCASEPCQNGGHCETSSAEVYECSCTDGYIGKNCEESIYTPCSSSPCFPNENCHNRSGIIICRCKNDYISSGYGCKRDPCNPSPCGKNAMCENDNGEPKCKCCEGFANTPPNCRPALNDPCRPSPCQANEDCYNRFRLPVCIREADVSAALREKRPTFTNKPGLLTAILQESDKRRVTELPWHKVTINGTTLSHPQDRESLDKLVGRFNGRTDDIKLASTGRREQRMKTEIRLYNTNNVGSVMADIINNITQLKLVDYLKVSTDSLRADCVLPPLDGNNTERYVRMYGCYNSSSLTSTLTQFIERLEYDGKVGRINLYKITQNEVRKAAVLDILWGTIKALEVQLWRTRPSVVFSTSLSSGDVKTLEPWMKLYLTTSPTPTERSTIDRMRKNGVLSNNCQVRNGGPSPWHRSTLIPWLPNKQEHDWSKL